MIQYLKKSRSSLSVKSIEAQRKAEEKFEKYALQVYQNNLHPVPKSASKSKCEKTSPQINEQTQNSVEKSYST